MVDKGGRASAGVLLHLRTMLDDGRDGERLPSERQLAQEFGTPRHVIRDAMKVLEAEGRIWRHVGQGTFVGNKPVESFGDSTSLVRVSSPVDLIEARVAFEPVIARFAAQRANSSHTHQLNWLATKADASTDQHTFNLWDERFHRTIAEASGNPVFESWSQVVSHVSSQITWGKSSSQLFKSDTKRLLTKHHRRIAEAIENRDLDRSQNLMLEHWIFMRGILLQDPSP